MLLVPDEGYVLLLTTKVEEILDPEGDAFRARTNWMIGSLNLLDPEVIRTLGSIIEGATSQPFVDKFSLTPVPAQRNREIG